jgi:hypothetical protein
MEACEEKQRAENEKKSAKFHLVLKTSFLSNNISGVKFKEEPSRCQLKTALGCLLPC